MYTIEPSFKKTSVQRLENIALCWDYNTLATVKECGNIISATYMSARPKHCPIRNLNKTEYLLVKTGEVCTKRLGEKRLDNIRSIKRSMSELRDLINANTSDPARCLWVTLTYAENMTDPERLYLDCKPFFKKLHVRYGDFEYVYAVEPQKRGAWHVHLILIFPSIAPFIPNHEMQEIWGHGFTKTQSLDNVDNIGAYLSAYLSDLPTEYQGSGKKFEKGARLSLYPIGMRFYRCSRGVLRPKKTVRRLQSFLQSMRPYECTYARSYKIQYNRISDDQKARELYITKLSFNKLRKRDLYQEKLREDSGNHEYSQLDFWRMVDEVAQNLQKAENQTDQSGNAPDLHSLSYLRTGQEKVYFGLRPARPGREPR